MMNKNSTVKEFDFRLLLKCGGNIFCSVASQGLTICNNHKANDGSRVWAFTPRSASSTTCLIPFDSHEDPMAALILQMQKHQHRE